MLINYFVEKDGMTETPKTEHKQAKYHAKGNERVRVNDKTASGGWY